MAWLDDVFKRTINTESSRCAWLCLWRFTKCLSSKESRSVAFFYRYGKRGWLDALQNFIPPPPLLMIEVCVMPRVICPTCERAINNCLCQWIEAVIPNQVSLGILQHPNETKQVKGTAKIVQLSLRDCQTWVGEHVSELPTLQHWLADAQSVFLLYPKIAHQSEPFSEWHMA